MAERTQTDGTEIDPGELAKVLEDRNLNGLIDPIRLVMELHRAQTYEQLFSLLKKRNKFGNFQIGTTNVAAYRRIMGNSHPDLHPTRCHLVVHGELMDEAMTVLNMAMRDTREKIAGLLDERENGKDEHESALFPGNRHERPLPVAA